MTRLAFAFSFVAASWLGAVDPVVAAGGIDYERLGLAGAFGFAAVLFWRKLERVEAARIEVYERLLSRHEDATRQLAEILSALPCNSGCPVSQSKSQIQSDDSKS